MGYEGMATERRRDAIEDAKWRRLVEKLDFAFQPIVSIHTGACFAYEALLRNHEKAGFRDIRGIFDAASHEEMLLSLDSMLMEKAVGKFVQIRNHERVKLFFNLDNRVFALPGYSLDETSALLSGFGLRPDAVCFEISERHGFIPRGVRDGLFDHFRRHAHGVVLDDFGTGFSGLQLLYHEEPDFIKIDRFFIEKMEADSKKRLFLWNVVNLAHALGIAVIAEGVEEEREYYACKQIGCDFVQGFLVQRPTIRVVDLKAEYEEVSLLGTRDARSRRPDRRLVDDRLEYIEPIPLHDKDGGITGMSSVFEIFRRNRSSTFFPVVNTQGEPVGLVRENDIKEFVYSKYGRDLLMNRAFGKSLKDFLVKCPAAPIGTSLEKILEVFSAAENSEGVILTENGGYGGFLTTRSLLNAINEKNLRVAADQNPLTKLPREQHDQRVHRPHADR